MTAPFRRVAKCVCGLTYPLEDEFNQWVRDEPELDSKIYDLAITDYDQVIHRFKTSHGRSFECIQVVEVKTRQGILSPSQRDTLHISQQFLRNRRKTPTKNIPHQVDGGPSMVFSPIKKRWVPCRHFGVHLLRLSGSTPDDSSQIIWDRKCITVEELILVLRFDLDPDTLKPLTNRSHHTKAAELPLNV